MISGNITARGSLTAAVLISLSLISVRYSAADTDQSTADNQMAVQEKQTSGQDRMQQAEACSLIPARLERLTCFDNVFNTSVIEQVRQQTETNSLPVAWRRAQKNEQHRDDETGFLLNPSIQDAQGPSLPIAQQSQSEEPRSLWATAPALGILPPRPVLMFSCIDKISRVELILPDAQESARSYLQLKSKHRLTQRWLSDESGLVLRSGRGIPAIQAMKTALSGEQLVLSSQDGSLPELMFDTRGLNDVLKPMREVCRW